MRQLFVKVPEGQGEKVIDLARQQAGVNLAVLPGHEDQDDWDIVMVHMPNRQVAYFLEELDALAPHLPPEAADALYLLAAGASVDEVKRELDLERLVSGW